jgi:protein ImuA
MASSAVAQDLLRALRHQIAKIEDMLPERLEAGTNADAIVIRRQGVPETPCFRTGAVRFDKALAGLPSAGLIELHGAATRDSGAVSGFALALAALTARTNPLPLLWIATAEIFREAGWPYLPGLAERFGILPGRLLLAEAEKLTDVLWIAEEAASLNCFSALILEVRGSPRRLDLTATRRLHRRALATSQPLFLLRQAGVAEPTAAPIRLIVRPAHAGLRHTLAGPLHGSIGPPAFSVTIAKSRSSPPTTFTLEWNRDTRSFEERDHDPSASKNSLAMVAASADGADIPAAFREVMALPNTSRRTTAGDQQAREQYPEDRFARRAG